MRGYKYHECVTTERFNKAPAFRATSAPLLALRATLLLNSTAMDAFITILSIISPSADVTRPDDAPVDAESGKRSNGGACTIAHKPVIDAPVDAESGKSSNGGACIVA